MTKRSIAIAAIALMVASAAAVGTRTALAATAHQPKNSKPKVVAQANEEKSTEEKTASQAKTPAPVLVTVNDGDSLSSIAEAHQSTWVRLYNANESVANPDVINPGQQLRVPSGDEQLADRPLPQPVVVASPVAQQSSYQQAPATSTYRAAAPTTTSYPTDPNAAKAFIYSKESGNNPNATNPNGCYGIGQDCNGVVRGQCGADYDCQDAYFTNYAMNRYGSWEAAQSFWNANGWW